jgi:hypothetical protein
MKIWIFNHYADDTNAPARQATPVHEFRFQLVLATTHLCYSNGLVESLVR